MIFSCYRGQRYFSWARTHDGDNSEVAQHGGHTPKVERDMQPWFTVYFFDIMLRSIDTCQINLSADQYHVTISWAQVYSSSRSHVLLKLTADQVLVFNWIAGSCQVDLLKREPSLKVNQIITVSSLQMFFVYSFCFVYRFCDFLTI